MNPHYNKKLHKQCDASGQPLKNFVVQNQGTDPHKTKSWYPDSEYVLVNQASLAHVPIYRLDLKNIPNIQNT